MQDRKGKKVGKKGALKVVARQQEAALRACFNEGGQHLLPLLELVRDAKASVDELMMGAARQFIEQLLMISAQEVAGQKHPGRRGGEVRWHGKQPGRIVLAERKLAVTRPRLRSREEGEVMVPAYARFLQHADLGSRVHDILVTGVSTRKYGRVLPAMAGTVGIAKSSVSREFVAQAHRRVNSQTSAEESLAPGVSNAHVSYPIRIVLSCLGVVGAFAAAGLLGTYRNSIPGTDVTFLLGIVLGVWISLALGKRTQKRAEPGTGENGQARIKETLIKSRAHDMRMV